MQPDDPLVRIMQTAVSPAVLISGVGLLVLSLTNRFSRTTERARDLAGRERHADPAAALRLDVQVRILFERSRLLLRATSFALLSILCAALLIIALFFQFLATANLEALVVALFAASLLSLVTSLVLFLRDMALSLRALAAEVEHRRPESPTQPGDRP